MSTRKPPHPPKLPIRRGPLTLLADFLVLFLTLYGAVFGFTSTFSLTVNAQTLLLYCALFAAASVLLCSIPRFGYLVGLGCLIPWALALRHLLPVLRLGEIAARCAVVNTFAQHWPSVSAIVPIDQLPDEIWLNASTVLLVLAAALLALLLGFSVVLARSFWLTTLLSAPFAAAGLLCMTPPDSAPLLALLTGLGTLLLARLIPWPSGIGRARLMLVSIPATAALLGLLLLLIPPSDYQRPQWAERANTRMSAWAVRMGERLLDRNLDGPLRLAIPATGDSVNLAAAGPLRYTGESVLKVETDLRGRLYLRGFSGAVYDGDTWQPLSETSYHGLDSVAGDSERSPTLLAGYQPMNFPSLSDRAANPGKAFAKFQVENTGANPGYVYYPYQLLTTPEQLGGAAFLHDYALGRGEGVWSHTLYVQPGASPYTGITLPNHLQDPERAYRSFVSANYMDVPDALWGPLYEHLNKLTFPMDEVAARFQMDVTGSTLAMTSECFYRLVAAQAVADYLGELCVYNPDTAPTPAGADFVGYFLDERREGYCMHFASAATLMLRALGVPARYVSGFVADVGESGKASVPDSNAHAWVEIYLDGYGWEPVEVTPAYAGGLPGITTTGREDPAPTATPNTGSAAPTPSVAPGATTAAPTATPKPVAPQSSPAADLARQLLPLWIVLGLLCALLLRRQICLSLRQRRFRSSDPNRCAIEAYLYLQKLRPWGVPVPDALEVLAGKARFSQHILTDTERDVLVNAAKKAGRRLDRSLPIHKRLALRYVFCLY